MTRIAAIVLAAGFSSRFGAENKLLAKLDGKPAIAHVLDMTASLPFSDRFVVVNRDGAAIAALCDRNIFAVLENKEATRGLGRSIALGAASAKDADAVCIILGDMPFVTRETYMAILSAFADNPDALIVAPTYAGRRGHPVLLARPLFAALTALDGDVGANSVVRANQTSLLTVDVDDPAVHRDFDTPSDLERLQISEH